MESKIIVELYSTKEDIIIREIHWNLASFIFFVNDKYIPHSKSPPIAAEPCQFILNRKMGETIKNIAPIKEYKSEPVKFLIILNEKNNWK